MIRFPTNRLILEGPDLAGKTTLYQQIHDKTGYAYNIQDRSALSMLVYAKLYNRATFLEVERLNKEIKDLNNRFIILLPSWEEVARRFNVRGDEIQNIITLKKLHALFTEAAEDLKEYPNVMVIKDTDATNLINTLVTSLRRVENFSLGELSHHIFKFASACNNFEATPINLTLYDDNSFVCVNPDMLQYEKERAYYMKIENEIVKKIDNELSGKNEYNRSESCESRRFVYASDTCISFAQFLRRDDIFDCHFVLRSSNTKDTLPYDLNFLFHLSRVVAKKLDIGQRVARIRINFNSAHVIL